VQSESGYYHAAPGEANDVTVTQDGQDFHIVDTGAPITAGDGCQSVNEHEVICTFAVSMALDVLLDDLDDSFSATDMTTASLVSGGDGDDTVQGGNGPDWFWGGAGDPGADPGEEEGNVAYGGTGNDTLIGGSGHGFGWRRERFGLGRQGTRYRPRWRRPRHRQR
jgi:Ca2+-binding RTX toxin-like protein